MSARTSARPRTMGRVVNDTLPVAVANLKLVASQRFATGDQVRARTTIQNDGVCPRRDIGEALVCPGDRGTVRESWRFLGDTYYTVEFAARAVYVIMRGGELSSVDETLDLTA